MKITRLFEPTDRYVFDFKFCTTKMGFAQVDTGQDASYFGTWANPFTLRTICYCEGDVTISDAENVAEFITEINTIKSWNDEQGHSFKGIDPGFNEDLKAEFVKIGLGDFLY